MSFSHVKCNINTSDVTKANKPTTLRENASTKRQQERAAACDVFATAGTSGVDMSLPYAEPSILSILILGSFLLLLNAVNYLLDGIIYCGLVGQVRFSFFV